MSNPQASLFEHVSAAYADAGRPLANAELYQVVADRAGISAADLARKEPIGRDGALHSPVKRSVRWVQQSLRTMGVIQKVAGARAVWDLSQRAGELNRATAGVRLLGFSTRLGVAIWGDCNDVYAQLDTAIHLCVSSPPFPLRNARAYGNPSAHEYTDFICRALEPIVRRLVPGGSICLNLSADIFEPQSPARSLYRERLTLALCDRFGLSKMDDLIWSNPSKPPAPVQWASLQRVQLNTGYEPILWLTNDPLRVKADNRRVLLPHSEKHLKLIAAGGEARTASYGDGAYRLRPGSFGRQTAGRIPRNVITAGHVCADSARYRQDAERLGLPTHGAMFPLAIPDFLIRFLSEEGDLIVDPWAGSVKTGMAAERLQRRWMVSEIMLDYLRPAAERFRDCDGFYMDSGFAAWPRGAAAASA